MSELRQRLYVIVFVPLFTLTPTVCAFPLSTEDTGTQGLGKSKIELTSEREVEREQGAREITATHEIALAHGLLEHFDASIAHTYRTLREQAAQGDSVRAQGVGDIKIGMKWRFYERDGLSFGLKGRFTAPTADAARKLGNGKPTQSFDAIASYATEPWALHFNLGYSHNRNTRQQREHLGRASTALVWRLDGRWKVMADVGVARNKSQSSKQILAFAGAGLAYAWTPQLKFELGIKQGLTPAETDFTGLVGMSYRF